MSDLRATAQQLEVVLARLRRGIASSREGWADGARRDLDQRYLDGVEQDGVATTAGLLAVARTIADAERSLGA